MFKNNLHKIFIFQINVKQHFKILIGYSTLIYQWWWAPLSTIYYVCSLCECHLVWLEHRYYHIMSIYVNVFYIKSKWSIQSGFSYEMINVSNEYKRNRWPLPSIRYINTWNRINTANYFRNYLPFRSTWVLCLFAFLNF